MKKLLLALLLLLVGLCEGLTQAIPDSLLSAATTVIDSSGRSWVYVAFSPENPRVLKGRALSVHLKNGLPADPGTFVRQGVVTSEVEVGVMSVLLSRGQQLGENLAELDRVLYELYRTRGAVKNGLQNPLPSPAKPPLAELLSALLSRAAQDAETASSLRMLSMGHPALKMALGEAWAGPLTVAMGQPVTVEVRELTVAGDGGVVARLTVTAGQPVVLPPPGPPVQVPDLTTQGDLNIKLRWGQDDDLRRQSPLSGGFHVWRVAKEFAKTQGFERLAPSLDQLRSWASAGNALKSAEQPVTATRLFYPAAAADVSSAAADKTTYFVTDDGHRYRKDVSGRDVDEPFVEGAEYTFFVTSVDILGRDGPPSLPGHGVVCRTLPPPVPGQLRVENHWEPDLKRTTGVQSLQFYWRANRNTARDVTTHYEVYRGTDLRALESLDAKAMLVPIAARVPHPSDGATLVYQDASPEILGADFGSTLWYSVRAVHVSPLGLVKSDFAAPVTIARRQREGPPPPRGVVEVNCARASVIAIPQRTVSDPALPPDDGLYRMRILCQRMDRGIAHVDLSVRVGGVITDLGQHAYAAEDDWVVADYEIPANQLGGGRVVAVCQSTTHTGRLSNPKETELTNLGFKGRRELTFQTRTLSDGDLVPGELFSEELLEVPTSVSDVTVLEGLGYAGGLGGLNDRTVVVETSPRAGALSAWVRRGHGLVRDGVVYWSMPTDVGAPSAGYSARVFPVREFGPSPCVDLAFNPGTGLASKLGVTVFTSPRTAEYRLFRRVDEGPYTLVGQGGASYEASNPVNAIRREDEALPMTDCTICYYAQTVDRDGNASALVRLEPCVERKAPVLPRPRLSPPSAEGSLTTPLMRLTWMCPPQGVERFLITIKAKGGALAQSVLEKASAYRMTAPLASRVVVYHSVEEDQKMVVTHQAAGALSNVHPGRPGDSSVLSLASGRVAFQKMVQTSTFVTPPLGDGFPTSPPFTAEFQVQPGATYEVFVQAVRGVILNGKGRGPASAKYEFKWVEPNPEPAVAWPMRPMSDVTRYAEIEAGELEAVAWPERLRGQRPVGIRIAKLPSQGDEDYAFDAGAFVYAPRSSSRGFRRHNPNAHVLRPLGNGVTQVQGVVVYRQQVANDLFPVVSGDTLQVTPLIRAIAWVPTAIEGDRTGARLVDPFFGITVDSEKGTTVKHLNLWLLDTQGVVDGARYHYYLVCFGLDGEITQTVDAGFYGSN